MIGLFDWCLFVYYNKIENLIDYFFDNLIFKGYYYNVNFVIIKGVEWMGNFIIGIFIYGVML